MFHGRHQDLCMKMYEGGKNIRSIYLQNAHRKLRHSSSNTLPYTNNNSRGTHKPLPPNIHQTNQTNRHIKNPTTQRRNSLKLLLSIGVQN